MSHAVLLARRRAPRVQLMVAPPPRRASAALPGALLPEQGWGSADKRVPAFHGILGLAAPIPGQCYFPLPFCKMTGENWSRSPRRGGESCHCCSIIRDNNSWRESERQFLWNAPILYINLSLFFNPKWPLYWKPSAWAVSIQCESCKEIETAQSCSASGRGHIFLYRCF